MNKTMNYLMLLSIGLFFETIIVAHKSTPINTAQPLKIKRQTLHKGSLHIVCGSMCAGKSDYIIDKVSRLQLGNYDVLTLKLDLDNRSLLELDQDPRTYISSRTGSWIECIPVHNCADLLAEIQRSQAQIIVIDEAHFFTSEAKEFVAIVRHLVESGKRVIIGGLELDFRGEAFGPMPELLAYADTVTKLTAICSQCGDDTYCLTQRLVEGQPAHYNDPLIVVGASQYEPRCRKCHVIRKD